MPFVCGFMCGKKSRKKSPPKNKARMDFRRADPKYTNFTPKNCFDAIDLFNRHRALGLSSALFPECFVHCARELPAEELDKFHRFIINPNGDITKGGGQQTPVDKELEEERAQLEQEAINRDMENLTIDDTQREVPSLECLQEAGPTDGGKSSARTPCLQMSQEDEKVAEADCSSSMELESKEDQYIKISVD
jgi:hypothetical protein